MYTKVFAMAALILFTPAVLAMPAADAGPSAVPGDPVKFGAAEAEALLASLSGASGGDLAKRACKPNGCKTCKEQCCANPYGSNLGCGL
ncbi:MAG: hypothetical protein Q9226_003186, partial [Calogaya cf. arnoldii]